MKNTILLMLNTIFIMLLALCSCGTQTGTQSDNNPSPIPTKAAVSDTNPISGPISNGNYSSAFTDATSAVTLFMSYQAAEGVANIDDGIIFEVTKENQLFYFRYSGGELESVQLPTHGTEITPSENDWYSNVKVYMP